MTYKLRAILAVALLGVCGCSTLHIPGDLAQSNELDGVPSYTSTPSEVESRPVFENSPSTIQEARLAPNHVRDRKGKDEVRGFRFVEVTPGSIYEDMGFKRNDVLLKVDDKPVTSPAEAMKGYQSMKENDFLEITILRDGREIVIQNQ